MALEERVKHLEDSHDKMYHEMDLLLTYAQEVSELLPKLLKATSSHAYNTDNQVRLFSDLLKKALDEMQDHYKRHFMDKKTQDPF